MTQEMDTVIYPEMQDKFTPRYLNLIMAHLDACKDVCDNFGITTTLLPYMDKKTGKITGFTVKSFKNPNRKNTMDADNDDDDDGDDGFSFAYDPFWDEDDTDFEALYGGIDDEDMVPDPYPEIKNKVPDDDDELIDITKQWVGKMMSDMGICPFSAGPEKAGLPIGDVFYHVDRSSGFEDMYAAYWHEVVRLELKNEKDMSTILLITPEFCMDNVELFESFTNTLTQPLAALEIEDSIQLVFFHPQWCFRDGSARAGTEQAANYARRSPWPMINILRTNQVRAAQKGIPTGLVYKQNEKTLKSVGVDKLETMLRLRDWSDIADLKVNRREYDALKIAQDYQQTGVIKQEDQSLAHDATPAANKVNRSQVEQGNLVNVVVQAMEKRLGKAAEGSITPLTGPETSASAMAADFLLEELDRIASGGGGSDDAVVAAAVAGEASVSADQVEGSKTDEDQGKVENDVVGSKDGDDSEIEDEEDNFVASENDDDDGKEEGTVSLDDDKEEAKKYKETDELKAAKAAQMEKARQALFDEMREAEGKKPKPPMGRNDDMSDILFGKSGIKAGADEEDLFPEGMNPESFY